MKKNQRFALSILLIIQFLERYAYSNVLIQIPIYIAQKGFENTLAWGQEIKGWIFFIWALVQNITPVFFGTIADRISPGRAILFSLLFICLGYWTLSNSFSIGFVVLSVIIIGLGSGCFKPSMQSLLSSIQSKKIWAYYLFINNLAFLLALISSNYFKSYSWKFVFLASFIVSLVNLGVSALILRNKNNLDERRNEREKVKLSEIFIALKQKKMYLIIGITTCFAIIYMQFYETMPNYIVDWVDTSSIVTKLSLPDSMTMQTLQGKQISYELLYIINPIFILLFVWFLNKFAEKANILNVLILAQFFVSIGFAVCGFTMLGLVFMIGIIVYTIGETLFNMKILEIVTKLAPEGKRATFFGVLNISYMIGLTFGALSGGYLYKEFAEKFTLAKKFIAQKFANGTNEEPFSILSNIFQIKDITAFLWSYYKPYFFWVPFLIIGGIGIILTIIYKKYKLN